jgi:hypothetical protein
MYFWLVMRSRPADCNSRISRINGITSRKEELRAMYSLSVVDSDISVCNFDVHNSGHPAYFMTNPERERAVVLSFAAVSWFQSPANPAST